MVAMAVAMEKIRPAVHFRFRQFHRLNAGNQVKYFHGSIQK